MLIIELHCYLRRDYVPISFLHQIGMKNIEYSSPGGWSFHWLIQGCTKRLKGAFSSYLGSMGGFLSQTQCAQWLAKSGVFWKIGQKKHRICSKLLAIWYTDESQNQVSRGIEMVEILKSTLSIPVQIFWKNPPPIYLIISPWLSNYKLHSASYIICF